MARDFDPVSDSHMRVYALQDLASAAKSFSLWVNIDDTDDDFWIFTGALKAASEIDDLEKGLRLTINHDAAGDLHCEIGTSGTSCFRTSNSGIISTGTWYNIVVTHGGDVTDSTDIHIYVDGSEVSYSANQNGTGTEETNDSLYLGAKPAGGVAFANQLDGKMAEMAIWTSVVSASDIDMLSNKYSSLFSSPSSMIAYSPLNGSSAYWADDADETITEIAVFGDEYWELSSASLSEHIPMIYHHRKRHMYTAPTGYMTESGGFWGAR